MSALDGLNYCTGTPFAARPHSALAHNVATPSFDNVTIGAKFGVSKAIEQQVIQYYKSNLFIMTFGIIAITCTTGYLAYMKSQHQQNNTYVAIAEDGTQFVTQKKSKWEH
ncbi:unnamed protein product, partial [Meganyctiphanes norvegica]